MILRVVSQLFVVIIKCRFDFPMVAMGEPDSCHEPHPGKLHYPILRLNRILALRRKTGVRQGLY